MQTAQPPQPTEKTTVMLFDETTVLLFDQNGYVEDHSVWSGTGELYGTVQKLTGYKQLDMWKYGMSHEDTNLIVAIYVSSEGPDNPPLNVRLTNALGSELFGKAVLVCFEEFEGDEAQSEWTNVISHEKLLEKLAERGKPVSVYHDVYPCILGDLMHELHQKGIKK
jgi:hypothetical protein